MPTLLLPWIIKPCIGLETAKGWKQMTNEGTETGGSISGCFLNVIKKKLNSPGRCASVGWSVLLCTERSQVQFLAKAHTEVKGSISSWVCTGGN